jgi:hypothetical protein
MGNLIPGEPLIYEYANGVIYAKYRDRRDIPRWVVGNTDVTCVDYNVWKDLNKLAKTNSAIASQLDKLINLYYLIKNEK